MTRVEAWSMTLGKVRADGSAAKPLGFAPLSGAKAPKTGWSTTLSCATGEMYLADGGIRRSDLQKVQNAPFKLSETPAFESPAEVRLSVNTTKEIVQGLPWV